MKHHALHTSRSSTGFPSAGRIALAPRFRPGPNVHRRLGNWSGSVRLALAGLVLLVLSLYWLYRAAGDLPAAPEPIQAPALPQIEFHHAQPIHERLDMSQSA